MEKRKTIALLLIIIGVLLSIVFTLQIDFPKGFKAYFKWEYYNQFGPLIISIELVIAGFYLFKEHKKTNFILALFGFTALLDALFNQIGLFNNLIPLYATIIYTICGVLCLWLAFSNSFKLKSLTMFKTIVSVILSIVTELFFNYFL